MKVGRMIAAVLGATIALWLLQGDTDASDAVTFAAIPHIEDSYSFAGLQTVEIRFTDGTAVTVMGSSVVPFMQALTRMDQARIDMELRPRVLERVER